MLAPLSPVLAKAQRGGYAVPAFNIYNLEGVQAVLAAAHAEHSPVILQTSEGAIQYAGMENLAAMVLYEAKKVPVPVVFHLDHGKDEELIVRAVKSGWYTSVMFDGSSLPYEENVGRTRRLVNLVHLRHVSVEAELGMIAGIEDLVSVKARNARFTDPEQAVDFVKKTGCNALAVAIGTSHGAYKYHGPSRIDLSRLERIRARVHVPLVLHGASGIPLALKKQCLALGCRIKEAKGVADSTIRSAIAAGISKVNIDSDLRLAFMVGVRSHLKRHPEDLNPRNLLESAKQSMEKTARAKIRLLGSTRKA